MARIIFNTKSLPEVADFVSRHKLNSSYKLVKCKSTVHAKEELSKRSLENEDVMVFVISDRENPYETVNEISNLRLTHENVKIVICLKDYSCISEIFELKPDYVMNLYQIEEKLMQIVDRLNAQSTDGEGIVITKYGKSYCISPDNILCFVKENRRVKTILDNGETFIFRAKIVDMSKKLPDYFVRCHMSCIINLNKVVRLMTQDVVLAGTGSTSEIVMPVSRAHKKEIKQLLRVQKNRIN